MAVTKEAAYALTKDGTIGYAALGVPGKGKTLQFVKTPRADEDEVNETIKTVACITTIVAGETGGKASKSFAMGSGKNTIVVVQPPSEEKLRIGVVPLGKCDSILAMAASHGGFACALAMAAEGNTINDGAELGVVTKAEEEQNSATDSSGEE